MCPKKAGNEQENFLMGGLWPTAFVVIQIFRIEYIREPVILKNAHWQGGQTNQTLGALSSKY